MSSLLFNLDADKVFRETLEEIHKGVEINAVYMNNIRYIDDTVLFIDFVQDLQSLLINYVNTAEMKYGFTINENKTKFMIVGHETHPSVIIRINSREIESTLIT